ncbi:putative ribosomal protein L19 [Candidatus Carsonella ruddii CS isolate Thao2000]|uniref:Putative ribosomal protein L19 n=1 Tax=Candidatus Carsonella ruddii CS isolate Thao2000 TaxID=1202537 RepID=J7H0F9_CARRU|nr:hypothetical protein [Candidatus Carsonella ruddii]AFP83795.1 putative ribosomal protein L19 [Candidatus Carsonella ruddii CS isolate Thao2000]
MIYLKKNDKIVLTFFIEKKKISIFSGVIFKIKKNTFSILKILQNYKIIKIFFIKNPNLISIKKYI